MCLVKDESLGIALFDLCGLFSAVKLRKGLYYGLQNFWLLVTSKH